MTLLDTLMAQGIRAFREPREAAADVMALGVPREALIPGLVLMTVVTTILNFLSERIMPTPISEMQPIQIAAFVMFTFGVLAICICKVGHAMQGTGKCEDSLLLMVFFQAIFLPLQAAQVVLLALSPALAGLLQLFILLFGIWVNVNFVAALHGYDSLGKSALVLFIASFAAVIVMMFLGPLLGISFVGPQPNV